MSNEEADVTLCGCGCGEPTRVYPGGKTKKFRRGHNTRVKSAESPRRTHGMSCTPTWYSWSNMTKRCMDTTNPAYPKYGGRGITVCDRWLGKEGFVNFLADMGERPSAMSLDRIDNDGNYEPSNCRWASAKEQALNTRSVTLLDIDIEWVRAHPEKSRKELAQILGVSEVTISNIRNRRNRFAEPT